MCFKIRKITINGNDLKYTSESMYLFALLIFADHIIGFGCEGNILLFCCHECLPTMMMF